MNLSSNLHHLPAFVLVAVLAGTATGDDPQSDGEEAVGGRPGPTQLELAIWRTPSYQRRFAESFVAEGSVEPAVAPREAELMGEALDLMAANDFDGAIALLRDELTPRSSASIDFMIGNLLYLQARLDDAAESLRMAVGKFPDFRRAWTRLGDLEARRGDPVAAHRALSRAHALGANDPDTLGLLGWSNAGLQRWLAAETAYRRALMLDPGSYDWRLGLADALVRQQRADEGLLILGELIEERPESIALWRRQAMAHLAAGKRIEAAEDLEILEGLGGGDFETRSLLGDLYLEQDMPALAASQHIAALADVAAPDPSRAFEALRTLTRQRQLVAAQSLVDRLEADHVAGFDEPERRELEGLVARLAVQTTQGAAEAAALERIVDADPLDGEALILLGEYHAARPGGFEKAEYWFERAAMLDDFRLDARLKRAEMLVAAGRYPQAIGLLKQVQLEEPRPEVKAYLDRIESYERNRPRKQGEGGTR